MRVQYRSVRKSQAFELLQLTRMCQGDPQPSYRKYRIAIPATVTIDCLARSTPEVQNAETRINHSLHSGSGRGSRAQTLRRESWPQAQGALRRRSGVRMGQRFVGLPVSPAECRPL